MIKMKHENEKERKHKENKTENTYIRSTMIVLRGSIMCRLSHTAGTVCRTSDCATEYKKMMTKCWQAVADKRPRVEDAVAFLNKLVGDDNDAAGATAS
jgi:hypothetical protein